MSGRAWCILRTSGRNTIPLFETLNEDGFTAWTPVERRMVRKPRSPSKDEVKMPITPSFVFARFDGCAEKLEELLALSLRPRKKQPDFSVMRCANEYAFTRDAALNALRHEQDKADDRFERSKFKDKGRVLERGTPVRLPDNLAFAGLEGFVERDDGRKALVMFGRLEVEVESFALHTADEMKKAA